MKFAHLKKAIEHLVDNYGPVYGRTRLMKLLYLADRAWREQHSGTYTEAKYYRWNHGPFAREVIESLEWMDGIEIVETRVEFPNAVGFAYQPGRTTRLSEVVLDDHFVDILNRVAAKWSGQPLDSLLDHVYGLREFKAAAFGEPLLR